MATGSILTNISIESSSASTALVIELSPRREAAMARKRGAGKMNCHGRFSPRLEATQTEAAVLLLSPRSLKRGRDGGVKGAEQQNNCHFPILLGFFKGARAKI